MSLTTDVRAALTGNAPVAALVGARVYPLRLPDNATLPAITYQIVSGTDVGDHADAGGGLTNALFQIDCWASTYAAAEDLGDKVKVALRAAAAFKVGRLSYRELFEAGSDLEGLPRRIVETSLWQ